MPGLQRQYQSFLQDGLKKSLTVQKILKEKKMKVKVTENCMGDRRCNDLCPEVFEYDEDELKSMVKVDEIPAQYEALVRQAADECGADAIIIEDE
jgi:ferredoxin